MSESFTGIVTGLQLEARIARSGCGRHARVACHGMGPKRAREAAEELVRAGAAGLVSFGLAGALVAQAKPGMVLLPSRIVTESGGTIITEALWRERLAGALQKALPVLDQPLASVKRPLPSYLDKASAWARTQAFAADMESAAIAAVARRRGVPFIALRAIADPVDFSLPPAAVLAINKNGRLNIWRLLLSLWRQPTQWRALKELAGHSRAARGALSTACRAGKGVLASPGNLPHALRTRHPLKP